MLSTPPRAQRRPHDSGGLLASSLPSGVGGQGSMRASLRSALFVQPQGPPSPASGNGVLQVSSADSLPGTPTSGRERLYGVAVCSLSNLQRLMPPALAGVGQHHVQQQRQHQPLVHAKLGHQTPQHRQHQTHPPQQQPPHLQRPHQQQPQQSQSQLEPQQSQQQMPRGGRVVVPIRGGQRSFVPVAASRGAAVNDAAPVGRRISPTRPNGAGTSQERVRPSSSASRLHGADVAPAPAARAVPSASSRSCIQA
eukprot:TRINITY_DN4718_c2_g1_i2.p1 TRINITY_DN4718_c2_g1~~TRINITY_DN4718_c2_g1_i2.p1  ORF type:complete len:282 (-),score=34.67 TRINITY_DN4718_c2_g1_i2:110-865(-)